MFASAAAYKQVHHTAIAIFFFCRKSAIIKIPTVQSGDQCLPQQQLTCKCIILLLHYFLLLKKCKSETLPTVYPGDQQCLPQQQQLRLTFSLRHMCVCADVRSTQQEVSRKNKHKYKYKCKIHNTNSNTHECVFG